MNNNFDPEGYKNTQWYRNAIARQEKLDEERRKTARNSRNFIFLGVIAVIVIIVILVVVS